MFVTKNYASAIEQASVLHEYQANDPDIAEKLMMLGYIAAMQDTARMLNESVAASTERGKAGRMYSIANDKLSRLGRAVMERAGELKV
jgi:hypothetical protein